MKAFFDRFILNIPRLYLKQYPYAWIVFIVLWSWPPTLSFIFLGIVLLGIVMLQWRHFAWIATMKNDYAPRDGKFHVDRPPVSPPRAARTLLILLAIAGAVSWTMDGKIGLTALHFFLIIVGFSLFYRDSLFFGAPTTYVITASGIGIHYAPGHLDYRPFLKFEDIARIERCEYQKDKGWVCFARYQDAQDGLLIIPKNPNGLTKRIGKLFITPGDIEKFQAQLPYGYR